MPGDLTATQIRTIEAIVNVLETGEVLGDYGQVTLIPGDTGHLTFGRSQTTLRSGNLHRLLERYCQNVGARFASRLAPFMPRFAVNDVTLDNEPQLHNVLRATADDPVMRDLQDELFFSAYFKPALAAADRAELTEPLSRAVVYDSFVHGSWSLIRKRVEGSPASLGERPWVSAYVAARRRWLATHSRSDLRRTVYRMDAFVRLIALAAWGLELPLVVRGAEISLATLAGTPPRCYLGPQPGTRELAFQASAPLQSGLDVRLVQLSLSLRGADIVADGVFGRASERCVADHQRRNGLPVTGVVDRTLARSLAGEI